MLDTVLGPGDPAVGRILLCFVVHGEPCIKLEEAHMDNYNNEEIVIVKRIVKRTGCLGWVR